MQIITLTTDFGEKDWYAGALKGALLTAAPEAQLVNITHEIEPFDIVQGALVLKNTWIEFPEGTIHCVAVNCVYDAAPQFVLVRHGGHFFLAPNNGMLTLLLGDIPPENVRLLQETEVPPHFMVKRYFAGAIRAFAGQTPFEAIGVPLEQPLLKKISLSPVVNAQHIRGTVVHIDHFDNVVLNIEQPFFEKVRQGRNFSLYFRKNDPITVLSTNYSDVPMGEPLCLFNHAGLLEIAVHFGKAATLLGLKKEDVVEVVFE
jgi:S-adenosyl-L-methionine hydrolase (adenosine-forming)